MKLEETMKRHLISVLAAMSCAVLLAIPVVAAETSSKTNHMATVRTDWAPETMTGRITQVEPEQHLVVVQSKDGVPFDIIVTAKTRIVSGNRTLALKDLATDQDRAVTIKFVPERRGDVAESIYISG